MSIMGITRRKFTLEFKTEAAHRVIDTGRSVVEVAAELLRLRRQVAEQEKDLAFLGKAAAYFASNPPKQRDLH